MPAWLTDVEYRTLSSVCDRLIPPDDDGPGASRAGVPDYIDGLLGAFRHDPPRIFAGGPVSGRRGGPAGFDRFLPLSALQELAWRIRLEGSAGIPEREFNGPVRGWQDRYRQGLAALGADFGDLDWEEQGERLRADPEFVALVYEHCCEGMYGAPEYAGNRDLAGWRAIGFAGDVQPRGYDDEEVSQP